LNFIEKKTIKNLLFFRKNVFLYCEPVFFSETDRPGRRKTVEVEQYECRYSAAIGGENKETVPWIFTR